ncbi:MAG: tetratricopeptide repeat protein, partial [Phycisphaerae bacterium]
VHANLGIALAREGRTDEADEHLREALRLRPEYPEALTALGNILAARGDLDGAIARHADALRLNPSLAEARINLGIALARKGDLSRAAAHLGEAVRRRPHSALAHANLALVLMKLGRAEEAVAHWERAVSLDSMHPDWQAHLADALLALGRTEQAIRQYRAVLAVRPDSPGVCNNLAWVLATRGRPSDAAEAVQLAQRACQATGWRDATALDTLAAAYAAQGRFAEAVETVRRGIDRAVSGGRQDLVADMNDRLRLYRTGRPYRDSAAPTTASAPSSRRDDGPTRSRPTAGEAGYRRERDSRRIGSTSMP